MGLSVGNNQGQNYANWSVKVDKNDPSAEDKFRLNRKGNTDPNEYYNILNKVSKEYISLMDSDGDGAVSFDEFVKFNVAEAKGNSEISDAEVEQFTPMLKQIFDKLNVDNSDDSKDKIDEREFMSFFITMDSNNDDMNVDGFVSKQEYIDTNLMLADNSEVGQLFEKCLKTNYFDLFKNYNK